VHTDDKKKRLRVRNLPKALLFEKAYRSDVLVPVDDPVALEPDFPRFPFRLEPLVPELSDPVPEDPLPMVPPVEEPEPDWPLPLPPD